MNRAPERAGSIPDQTVEAGATETVDLSSYFRDPDGDALSYTAMSSDSSVVSVSVSGATLTIGGVAVGAAQVMVTARDPDGLAATQAFGATVPNRAPAVLDPIPDQTVHVGEEVVLDLSPYFVDADGDALSYTAMSSDSSVVSVSVSGATLTIGGVAVGAAQVMVTTRDPDGLAAHQTFSVTVPNRAPAVLDPIPDQIVHVGEEVVLGVSPYFVDADGDALSYTAMSSDSSVVSVSVSGATLTIGGVAVGAAQVTVTARDPDGLGVTQAVSVIAFPPGPDLTFTDVSPASATLAPGDSVTFTFRVLNQGTVASGGTTVRALRSPNPIISTRDTELRSHSLSSLAPAQDRTFEVTVSVDLRSAPGTVYLGMCVDPVTDESNTRNNCSGGARLSITGSSTAAAAESTGSGSAVRIRIVSAPQFRRPAAPFRRKQSR